MTDQTPAESFAHFAVLELMGHRRLGGLVTEQQIAGAPFLRIDVPGAGDRGAATQYYSASAVYAITPCTEETARRVAQLAHVAPVQRWELPAAPARHNDVDEDDIPY